MKSQYPPIIPIAYAQGDGIGPEIMDATLKIIDATNSPLEWHEIEIGEKVYLKGHSAGIEPKSWETISSCKAFLKAPISTPQGGGFRSLNVTIRTALGLYANVRPCVAYSPFIKTKHPHMDVVIIRENEEDLYTGLEYSLGPNSFCGLKIITREACERIIRYAFDYAIQNERKKVTCFTKDNILKFSDGLFHKVFNQIAENYPSIEAEHWIVDIGAAKLADTPEAFDVIVMPNLYGDILSDVAAQIAGSVGLAGSANIGMNGAMFEAIHGSAPRRAGQNLANPSGLLLASVMMLNHVGLHKNAELIHNSWLTTLEQGIHTYDIYEEGKSLKKVGTQEFAQAVISNLGNAPKVLHPVHYKDEATQQKSFHPQIVIDEEIQEVIDGCDIYFISNKKPSQIAEDLQKAPIPLKMIGNRGAIVWPDQQNAFLSDTFRARFISDSPCTWNEITATIAFMREKACSVTSIFILWKRGGVRCYNLSPQEQ